jgi:subtilisin family serine protease
MISACRLASAATWVGLALLSFGCGDRTPVSPVDATTGLDARRASTAGAQGTQGHIILLKEGVTADLTAAVVGAGGKVKHSYREIGVLSATGLSAAAVAQLAARPEVQAVTANPRLQWIPPLKLKLFRKLKPQERVKPKTDQSGAAFFNLFQWNMRVIQADAAWLTSNQGRGTRVAVLDSGIDPTHIDLQGTVDPSCSASFVPTEGPLTDFLFHGTFVAGIIRSNGIGVASVAPDATLCSVKVGNGEGLTLEAIIGGIVYAGTIHADVANMSFSGTFDQKNPDDAAALDALNRAVKFAAQQGVLLVAALGNDAVNTNTDPKSFVIAPAELQHVISVGATAPVGQQNFDQIASYSNFGRSGVDVFAPGGDFVDGSVDQDLILSPCSPTTELFDCSDGISYLIGAGTSFATPHVVGEAAVIESQFPGNQKDEFLANCILKSADAVTGRKIDPLYDRGRINVLHGAACAPGKKQGGTALAAGSLR